MNKLAIELNETLERECPPVYEMLSERGKNLFFPKGIISQSAEAKQKAHKFNATIGIATEGGVAMHLPSIARYLPEIPPNDAYSYAPPPGKPQLRDRWLKKQLEQNPSLKGKHTSKPIVTAALTHGLSLTGDLFVDRGDVIVLPDKFWGNYNLCYCVRLGAVIRNFPTFTERRGYNVKGMAETLQAVGKEKGKAILLMNFPNNPSGYTPTEGEADAMVDEIVKVAQGGSRIVVVCDDAYFDLFYEDCLKESFFARIANRHPNVLAVRLDGATKEHFVWGFRVGFITYACGCEKRSDGVYDALEKKTMGAIRGAVSNCSHPAQTIILKALDSPEIERERKEKFEILKARARKVKEVLDSGKYDDAWTYYPFNSGYFMCVQLKDVNAEELRVHLLDRYGVGLISSGDRDIRVAFSSTEEKDIPELFDIVYKGVQDLRKG